MLVDRQSHLLGQIASIIFEISGWHKKILARPERQPERRRKIGTIRTRMRAVDLLRNKLTIIRQER